MNVNVASEIARRLDERFQGKEYVTSLSLLPLAISDFTDILHYLGAFPKNRHSSKELSGMRSIDFDPRLSPYFNRDSRLIGHMSRKERLRGSIGIGIPRDDIWMRVVYFYEGRVPGSLSPKTSSLKSDVKHVSLPEWRRGFREFFSVDL